MENVSNSEHPDENVLENNVNIENITLSRIAAMIVHDIKNPLNNILLSCSAMDEMQLHDEHKNCVELIRRNSNRINLLLNDLSMATTDLRMNMQPVNIHTLLTQVLRSVKGAVPFNEIVVNYSYELNIAPQVIDKDLMEKALFNILTNAFEAVDEKKGTVEITSKTTDGVDCIIEIKDNGKGIAKEHEAEIFAPCFSMKPGHRGLGLSIANNILKQHNGNLSLGKSTREGTLFVIRLSNTTTGG